MPDLVALALPPGQRFVDEIQRAWDDGDAILPIDLRLPDGVRDRLLDRLGATVVVDESGRARRTARSIVEPGDAVVVATSGTTGEPKGVVLTHDAVRSAAWTTSRALDVHADDTWLACLPLAHIGGLSVVIRSLVTETPLVVLPRFDAGAVEASARRGATLVSLVATAMRRIDTSVFRKILLGGAAPPAEIPANVVVTWGMTETAGGVVYDYRPLPGVEVRADDGGELWVRSPTLLRRYTDGTDPKTSDGWFATGDAGSVDASGRVTVAGRIADVINSGAEKVWPNDVETVLRLHPSVDDALVFAEPDPEWGERVVAIVESSEPPAVEDLRAFARERLAPYAVPKEIRFVDALPRTSTGKVRRPAPRPPGS